MPTRHPRLNVVLERPLYEAISRLAKLEGTSRSLKARDMLRECLETYEDVEWAARAEARERTFDPRRAFTVEGARRKLGLAGKR